MEDKYKALIACFGMGCATVIEVVNLVYVGIDGAIASAFLTVLGGIVGVAITGVVQKAKSEGSA